MLPAEDKTPADSSKTVKAPTPKPQKKNNTANTDKAKQDFAPEQSQVDEPLATDEALLPDTPAPDHSPASIANQLDDVHTQAETSIANNNIVISDISSNNAETTENYFKEHSAPTPVETSRYKYVETDFAIYANGNAGIIGDVKVSFSQNDDNTYQIESKTSARGLATLFFDTLTQKSIGTFNQDTLKPNHYTYNYGNNQNKSQSANFAWTDGLVVLQNSKGTQTVPLKDGVQDMLSFMYNFSLSPPLDNMELSITNGKNLRVYHYRFDGEEEVDTGVGLLKTLHITKTSKDQEKTELWLAVDYQFIPVKIRKTEENGSYIEQIATKISALPQ